MSASPGRSTRESGAGELHHDKKRKQCFEKKRDRSVSRERKRHRERKRRRSSDPHRSASCSSSDNGRKRRKHKHKKQHSPSRREQERKARKKAKKQKKKEKKERKEKKKAAKAALSKGNLSERYGKYGVIRDEDIYSKQDEFFLWLNEVKHRSRETMTSREEKDLFREFCEDFNTATLPHKKFYNVAAWEAFDRQRHPEKYRHTEDAGLGDEDRLRVQRQRLQAEQKRAFEEGRVRALLDQMRTAKEERKHQYKAIVDRHQDMMKKPTLESIAEKRRKKKAAEERKPFFEPYY